MSIWLALWLSLSFVLVVFMVWTLVIMLRQKAAWKRFAADQHLRYKPGPFFSSPEVSGVFEDYTVSVFGSEHTAPDSRNSRKLTAIEITLKSKMPMAGAVGSGGMIEIIKRFDYHNEFKPADTDWSKEYIAVSRNSAALEAYLDGARVKALSALMKIKNVWLIFIFEKDDTLLRIDTPDPLEDKKRLVSLLKKMVRTAKILELREEESKTLSLKKAARPAKGNAVPLKEDGKEDFEFELEEDEPES